MAISERYAITCAAAIIAPRGRLQNKSFIFHSDSQVTVNAISRYYAREKHLAEIVRSLIFLSPSNTSKESATLSLIAFLGRIYIDCRCSSERTQQPNSDL
jgi:hypothetical protein